MEPNVSSHLVLVDKSGKEPDVFAQQDSILMIKCVLNVLMDKFGIKLKNHVFVRMDINGMDSIVKEPMNALKIGYGMKLFSNAFVKKTIIGVATPACQFQPVEEVNTGMQFL